MTEFDGQSTNDHLQEIVNLKVQAKGKTKDLAFKRVHFIGIGGSGMSGIALVLHQRGITVTGSDLKTSRFLQQLEAQGIHVFIGHDAKHIALTDPDVVVVSTAIQESNPEYQAAREQGRMIYRRAQMLSALAHGSKTLAVAGTHGKTTTSSMLAETLDRMGLDPTFLIGGMIDTYNANGRFGSGEYFVCEADESDASFLYLDPHLALVTNIEADHLDHYGSLANIKQAFCDFVGRLPQDEPTGAVICCADDLDLVELMRSTGKRVITYGFAQDADVRCEREVSYAAAHAPNEASVAIATQFSVTLPDGTQVHAALGSNPGIHNILNATAVLAAVHTLGLDVHKAALAISQFKGVRRRFDVVGFAHASHANSVAIVDDYAHHPTEIEATLKAAKSLPYQRVWAIFQPHRYSRTQALADDFGRAFASANRVTIMDVYAAGETPIPGVTGKLIAQKIEEQSGSEVQVSFVQNRLELIDQIVAEMQPGDIILTLGAGDITRLGTSVLEACQKQGIPVKVVRP